MRQTPNNQPQTYQEQIDTFNREVNEFYASLKASNFTDEEIRRILAPVNTSNTDSMAISRILINTVIVLSIIFLVPILYSSFMRYFGEQLDWHFASWGRTALITLLPFWDWTHWKNEQCLVNTPWKKQQQPQPQPQPLPEQEQDAKGFSFSCDLCESLDRIDVYGSPIDEAKLKTRYLDVHTPVVFDGSFWKWSDHLLSEIQKTKGITASYPCSVGTNIHEGPVTTVGKLLQKAEVFDGFFLHFQNCDRNAMKHFRSHTPRPLFLPVDLRPVQYNWLLWSNNYNISTFKKIHLVDKVSAFVQVTGRNYVKLIPRGECNCPIIDLGLNEGEALLFTSLWDLKYRPEEKSENLAVILETH